MLPGSMVWDRPQRDSPWFLLLCHRSAARGYVCHTSHLGRAGCCNRRKHQLATSPWTYTQVWKRQWYFFSGWYNSQKGLSKSLLRLPTFLRTFKCWGTKHPRELIYTSHLPSFHPTLLGVLYFLPALPPGCPSLTQNSQITRAEKWPAGVISYFLFQ